MTTRFTGFFKSSGLEGVFIAALKGDGFEVVMETRTPDAAEACLRAAFPDSGYSAPVVKETAVKEIEEEKKVVEEIFPTDPDDFLNGDKPDGSV